MYEQKHAEKMQSNQTIASVNCCTSDSENGNPDVTEGEAQNPRSSVDIVYSRVDFPRSIEKGIVGLLLCAKFNAIQEPIGYLVFSNTISMNSHKMFIMETTEASPIARLMRFGRATGRDHQCQRGERSSWPIAGQG